MANVPRRKKKSSLGCLWFFLIMAFMSFTLVALLGGGTFYLALQAKNNPQKFLKDYNSVVSIISDQVVGLLSSDEPMLDVEREFDADAYNEFVQKVGQFQQIINNPNASNVTLKLTYSSNELINGFMQDLARYEVTRYNLNFEPGLVHAQTAVKGEILVPYIPAEVPEVFRKSLEKIRWINLDFRLRAAFENDLNNLVVESLKIGDFKVSQFLLQKLNEYLELHRLHFGQNLKQKMIKSRMQPVKIQFDEGLVHFEGIYNPSQ